MIEFSQTVLYFSAKRNVQTLTASGAGDCKLSVVLSICFCNAPDEHLCLCEIGMHPIDVAPISRRGPSWIRCDTGRVASPVHYHHHQNHSTKFAPYAAAQLQGRMAEAMGSRSVR
jgi:hypothetical protein